MFETDLERCIILLVDMSVTVCGIIYRTGIVGHPLGHCSNKEGKVIKRQTKTNSSWNN